MRIISGTRRGARIAAPKGLATRPTGDRVREAAFNLIGPVEGAAVLDLYAGSGALGLEALSRGADHAVFVEADASACRTISANLERMALTGARVVRDDVFRALRAEIGGGRLYDLVLCDPPYGTFASMQTALADLLPRVLSPDGLLVVETGAKEEPGLPLRLVTSRRYGAARVTLFGHP